MATKTTKASIDTAQFEAIAQEAANIGKTQVDALMKSGTIFSKGMEDIFKSCLSFAQRSAEKNNSAVKSLMSCKTIEELTEAQNKIAQQSFDDFMSEATKISELGIRVCSDSIEPINDQVSKTIRKSAGNLAA